MLLLGAEPRGCSLLFVFWASSWNEGHQLKVPGCSDSNLSWTIYGAFAQLDNNRFWTYLHSTVPPAVGLMADVCLERNLELPGDVRGTQGQRIPSAVTRTVSE